MYKITVLKGDGIGPEVVDAALDVLNAVNKKYGYEFSLSYGYIGGRALDEYGVSLPEETIDMCQNCDAVLLGAVGGPKWDNVEREKRPEVALLNLRHKLKLFANLRNGKIYPQLVNVSPLKVQSIDIMIVRELTGGMYFGDKAIIDENGIFRAYDVESYTNIEVERIAKIAFQIADKRKRKVMSIDKANILESSRLWRKTVQAVSKEFQDVELEHIYADNASIKLIKNPEELDVLLTNNIFGDILSDELSAVIGSIGMLPSASIGSSSFGLYEPSHGSAPYMTGMNRANPIATILSLALLFDYSLNLCSVAEQIEMSVKKVLDDGWRTSDIYRNEYEYLVGTKEMGELISKALLNLDVSEDDSNPKRS